MLKRCLLTLCSVSGSGQGSSVDVSLTISPSVLTSFTRKSEYLNNINHTIQYQHTVNGYEYIDLFNNRKTFNTELK